jgi:hypothetical protein
MSFHPFSHKGHIVAKPNCFINEDFLFFYNIEIPCHHWPWYGMPYQPSCFTQLKATKDALIDGSHVSKTYKHMLNYESSHMNKSQPYNLCN